MHFVTKTYGHENGLSACFRQWRAKSHCHFLHGYPLSFKFTFAAEKLDENGWVIDFGSLKPVKQWLCDTFDHELLIAADDPQLDYIASLSGLDIADHIVLPGVGCESFARLAWDFVEGFLTDGGYRPRVSLTEVEVREHNANGVIFTGDY